ncbi:MAG: hypothetical protein PHV11_08950 [Candidatus Bipolaricaulis sp.]|nr:hypothetical protein [Candidatus Bipolaricaulis sp.]
MTLPEYHIYIDFDCPDWAGAHDFTQAIDDITADVQHLRISRGKDKDSNNYPAATLELILENSSGKYYPTATAGDYVGKIRLWLPVKVTAVHGGNTYGLFYGYLNRITAYPITNRKIIYFYATDGVDLLAKTIVVQDMDDKTVMSDGEAVHKVLNAAGWRTANIACTFQNAGDTVTKVGHGLANGDMVMFEEDSLPAEVDPLVLYYVVLRADDTFCISTTSGGAAVEFTSDGTGYYHQILRRAVDVDGGDITYYPDTFEFTKP